MSDFKVPETLLAKTPKTRDSVRNEETLVGHCRRVRDAAAAILDSLRDSDTLAPVPLSPDEFRRLVLAGAVLHDLGKANSSFQGTLARHPGLRRKPHPILHDLLGAIILSFTDGPLKDWAQSLFSSDTGPKQWWLAWMIGGHHVRLDRQDSPVARSSLYCVEGVPAEFVFYGGHPDVGAVCELAAGVSGRSMPDGLVDLRIPILEWNRGDTADVESLVLDFLLESESQAKGLDEGARYTVALAKAIVVSADVAGSARVHGGDDPGEWIPPLIRAGVDPAQISDVITDQLEGARLDEFQRNVAASEADVTLVEAGCGNGKTIAAYAWAREHAGGRKLFFCYPTTGTASAGFHDYLLAQTDLERTLLHSRATVDLEYMLQNEDEGPDDISRKTEAFGAWGQEVIACTADTVLGLVQNQRRGLFSFPTIARGAFVFDEIHSYDAKLFGALLRFLSAFPSHPVLLMTASLPPGRRRAIEELLGQRYRAPIGGNPGLEASPRYTIRRADSPEACFPAAVDAVEGGGKVLWVCNKVADAVSTYREIRKRIAGDGAQPLVYHSRFRYRDRVQRQNAVLAAFRNHGPAIVVATQVCEMSLNISADLLITAQAPFASIVQRLGRLNRPSQHERETGEVSPAPCTVYPFTCRENRPYGSDELRRSWELLDQIEGKPVSQRDLKEKLTALTGEETPKTYSAWMDDAHLSARRPLREDGASITVVLEQDLSAIREELAGTNPTSENLAARTVPMYYSSDADFVGRCGPFPIAARETIEYNEETGARWTR